jgi:ribosome maturation factor RimP
MDGGSRHGSRGQAHSSSGGTAARRADPRAPGSRNAESRTARTNVRPAVPLPDGDRLTRLLEPVVHALGMDLEGIKVSAAGRRRLLRVVVDADGGVSLDAIALASRELSARLDGATEMGDLPYTLEVSSPGVDRPLTERRHWRRAVGRLVVVPLAGQHASQVEGNGAARAEGRIASTSDRGVTLDCDGELREFAYAELGPGRVQVEFGHLEPGDGAGEDGAGEDGADEDYDDYRAEED